jgi:hypothetical protein
MNYRFSKAQNRLVFRYVLLILATNPYQVSYSCKIRIRNLVLQISLLPDIRKDK